VRHDPDVAGHADVASVGWFDCRCGGHGEGSRTSRAKGAGEESGRVDCGDKSADMRLGPRGLPSVSNMERV
jgi:hypothetical protein